MSFHQDQTQTRWPAGADWTASQVVAAVFVVIYLTIQVLVPLRAVIRPGQDEFGWQMYSEKPREFSYEVFTKDGTTKVINRSDFQASRRPEISFEKFLPEHLCDEVAGAVSVSVTRIGTQWQRTHPCRP